MKPQIRSAQQLRDALAAGQTIHVHLARPFYRLDTDMTVFGRAFDTVREAGGLVVIRRDLCGDPMQYGAPGTEPPPRPRKRRV